MFSEGFFFLSTWFGFFLSCCVYICRLSLITVASQRCQNRTKESHSSKKNTNMKDSVFRSAPFSVCHCFILQHKHISRMSLPLLPYSLPTCFCSSHPLTIMLGVSTDVRYNSDAARRKGERGKKDRRWEKGKQTGNAAHKHHLSIYRRCSLNCTV